VGRKDRDERRRREAASRARRSSNAAAARPPAPPPITSTEASTALVAALEYAGHHDLAERAAKLEFDDVMSPSALPLNDLVALLVQRGEVGLIDRVTAGDFDATPADQAAYDATPAGAREAAETDELWASIPQETRDLFDQAMTKLAGDPRAQQRMMQEHLAELQAAADRAADRAGHRDTGGALDDDRPVGRDEVPKPLWPLLAATGPNGERLGVPAVVAAGELAGRTGGSDFEMGWTRDGVPTERAGWYAQATWERHGNIRVGVYDQPGPVAAALAFAGRILDGGQCQGCGRITSTNPDGVMGGTRTLVDGRTWTYEQQAEAGVCVWQRRGITWAMGCKP
jgi:hypothetical protein